MRFRAACNLSPGADRRHLASRVARAVPPAGTPNFPAHATSIGPAIHGSETGENLVARPSADKRIFIGFSPHTNATFGWRDAGEAEKKFVHLASTDLSDAWTKRGERAERGTEFERRSVAECEAT